MRQQVLNRYMINKIHVIDRKDCRKHDIMYKLFVRFDANCEIFKQNERKL